MIDTKANIALVIYFLVIPAKRLPSGFRLDLVKVHPVKDTPRRLNPLLCRSRPLILDHLNIAKPCFAPVVLIKLARDVVRVHAIMRQDNMCILVTVIAHPVDVVR